MKIINSKNIHLEKNIQRNIHSKNLTNIHSKRLFIFFKNFMDALWFFHSTFVRSKPSLAAIKAAKCSEEAEDLSFRGSTSNLYKKLQQHF